MKFDPVPRRARSPLVNSDGRCNKSPARTRAEMDGPRASRQRTNCKASSNQTGRFGSAAILQRTRRFDDIVPAKRPGAGCRGCHRPADDHRRVKLEHGNGRSGRWGHRLCPAPRPSGKNRRVRGETRHSSDIIEGCPPAPGRRAVGPPATRTPATNTPPATLCSASGSAR